MGDRFAYRLRVSGADLDEYVHRLDLTRLPHEGSPGSLDMFEWGGPLVRMSSGREMEISGHWYNVSASIRDAPEGRFHQLLGNCSSAPLFYFLAPGTQRSIGERLGGGPFDGLVLAVEIVGMSHRCDVPGGKYSYRTTIQDGKVSDDDSWTSLEGAIAHAPDLYRFATSDRCDK
jgi:hypothetical protein